MGSDLVHVLFKDIKKYYLIEVVSKNYIWEINILNINNYTFFRVYLTCLFRSIINL